MLLGLPVLVLVLALVAASWATAATRPQTIASYCSSSGDLCYDVLNRSGAVSLELRTFARYFDRYNLCVRPPQGASTCRSFPIRKSGAFYVSRVRWHLNFPARGPGSYTVSWRLKANALGPQLRFRLPLR